MLETELLFIIWMVKFYVIVYDAICINDIKSVYCILLPYYIYKYMNIYTMQEVQPGRKICMRVNGGFAHWH